MHERQKNVLRLKNRCLKHEKQRKTPIDQKVHSLDENKDILYYKLTNLFLETRRLLINIQFVLSTNQ